MAAKTEHNNRKRARGMLNRGGYNMGGHVTPKQAVTEHETHMHPGKRKTFKTGGRVDGAKGHAHLGKKSRSGLSAAAKTTSVNPKELNRVDVQGNKYADGGRTKHKGKGAGIHIVIGTPSTQGGGQAQGAAANPMALKAAQQQGVKAGMQLGAQMAAKAAQGQTVPPPGPPAGGMPPPGAMPPGGPPGPMGARPPMPPQGMPPRPPGMKRGGRAKCADGGEVPGGEAEEGQAPSHARGGRTPGLELTKRMPGSASNGEGRLAKTKFLKGHETHRPE